MRKSGVAFLIWCAVALLTVTNIHAQPGRTCVVPPQPRIPVQWNLSIPPQAAQQNTPNKVQVVPIFSNPMPSERFLVIDSVAVKGVVPQNTYLAIELRTVLRTPSGAQPLWVRHFLHSQATGSTAAALHLRENVKIHADAGNLAYIGIRTSAGSAIDLIDVAFTGTLVSTCLFGTVV
jgi:hypothetical protein